MEQECGVRVMCRFRPLNESEVKRGKKSIIQFKGDDTVVVSGKPYVFDKVLSPSMTQEQVYEFCAKHTVIDVLGGYNGTLFTYGQTSSGKTHTMEGRLHDPQMMGIIPRVAYDIFNHIYSMQENTEFHIKDPRPDTYFYCEIQTFMHSSLLQVSYFEIYLEKIRDLLDVSKTNLPVHENKNRVPFVKGCSERFVSNPEEMMGVIDEGKANRRVAVTNMNEHSSRSHSIFLINIKQEHLDTAHKLTGKLYLVDLAGSEKVSKTGATGAVLDEAKMINKSLSALGNVISALAEGTKSYVPYRDSKMTRILQDSLGGNCRTTIIICCSPSTFNEAETRSTLLFGQRAKSIRNTVCVNLELTAEEWKQKYEKEKQKGVAMKQLVDKLQTELNHWKTGVCVPVMEQLFDGQQEELSSCAPVVSNGLASETLGLENGPCEENITKLYKLMDDKDEEIHLQTQLMEKLTLHLEVQEEFLASSQRDCARVQEELCSLLRNNEEMKGEVWEVLSALEELALNYDRKSQNASNSAHMNGTLSEQLAMKNEMIAATQSELTELQELDTVEKGRVVDILHVLLKDLCDVASAFSVCEIKMVCEDGISLDDEFSAVHLFLTKLKSELKSFINRIKRLESTHEHTSFNILANERELASCRFLVSQYEVKIRSLTECIPKAEETEKELELTQRTLTEELTELRTYESNQDLCELETQEELLKRNPSQQNPDALMEGHRDDPSKTLIELREEFNNRQRVLDEVQEINENLILEQKRLQCENETLRIQEQEKEIKLHKLTESNESTERRSNDLREFEETLVWQLQCLHNLRKMFVQDLATHMKESSAPGCEDGGNRVIHKRKISFLENNLEQLTKVHKQLVQQNADLRCALPKLQKRLCAMMERVESLECALREAKQSASRERRLYQQELDRIRDIVRAKCMASYRHAPLIVKPIRAGHHHTFSVMAGGGSTIYSHHHV